MKATPETIQYQREYFTGDGRTGRIALGETPCVRRHFAKTIDPLGLRSGARVLEIGCGMGRFTRMLLDRGFEVTALDLSPYLIERLRAELPGADRLTAVAGRAEDIPTLVSSRFDAVVGFFFLHHLRGFDDTFAGARAVLGDEGRIAFCEPNAFNPLVYLQVTFTRGMSWSGEPSIPLMRPSVIFPALERQGFARLRTELYGALPPVVANTKAGAAAERAIEWLRPLRPFSAYRIFAGQVASRR
ncbi:MAG TPA: class I SAM-dependent methyltransferase [Vicinamibacterales bacterium]|nr:class I SAM-dependent methyltransferase [Vicinamibacterales bacterium]